MLKPFLGAVAIALTFYAFLPYIRSIRAGTTKPHVFSWVTWGAVTFVVFLAQLAGGGGAGAWPIGISGLITLYVACLAYSRRGDVSVTRLDWAFFLLGLAALPLWYATSDPLWAVVLLTLADALGFAPTFRKAWHRPFQEPLNFYVVMALRNAIAIAALERYSLTTVLFPAGIGALAIVFIVMVAARRRRIAPAR